MRLIDLNPWWVGAGGEGITRAVARRDRAPIGARVSFDCPCGCGEPGYVPFENPIDGGPQLDAAAPAWRRTGDTFDTLTLTPSILRSTERGGCGWHGYITNGEVTSV